MKRAEQKDTLTHAEQNDINQPTSDPEGELVKKQVGPQDLDYWDDLVGQRINDAVKQGMFDNLRGAGKPLKLRGNPMAGDRQLAFDLMEDNDLSPQWIGDRKLVQEAVANLRAEIRDQAASFLQAFQASEVARHREDIRLQWQRHINEWAEKIARINDQMEVVNFMQPPVPTLELIKLRLSEELKRAGVTEELHAR